MLDITQIDRQGLDGLSADQLRELVNQLLDRGDRDANEIVWRDTKIRPTCSDCPTRCLHASSFWRRLTREVAS